MAKKKPTGATISVTRTGSPIRREASQGATLKGLGLLRGHETVADAMADADLARFIETLMRCDIAPHIRAPASLDVGGYITLVLGRFRNPAIRHLLSQIAWDGSKKLPFRLLETITEARASGRPIESLALPVAAWFAFIRHQAKAGVAHNGEQPRQRAWVGDDVGPLRQLDERFLHGVVGVKLIATGAARLRRRGLHTATVENAVAPERRFGPDPAEAFRSAGDEPGFRHFACLLE